MAEKQNNVSKSTRFDGVYQRPSRSNVGVDLMRRGDIYFGLESQKGKTS